MRKVVAIENVSTWRTNEEVLSLLSSSKVLIVSMSITMMDFFLKIRFLILPDFEFSQVPNEISHSGHSSRAVVSRVRYEEDNGHKRIH